MVFRKVLIDFFIIESTGGSSAFGDEARSAAASVVHFTLSLSLGQGSWHLFRRIGINFFVAVRRAC